MIPKGTNVVVNFYATNVEGIPLSTAAGITPYYRLNGGTSNSLLVNISSLGSDAPGWFRFSTAQFNNSTGNLFITFSNSSNYAIMPWEDDIVQVGGATASDIWDHSFSGNTASAYLYSASANAYSAYTAVGAITIPTPPTTGDIATSVWTHTSRSITTTLVDDGAQHPDETYIASQLDTDRVPGKVWGFDLSRGVTARNYLMSIGSIPRNVWTYKSGATETESDRSLTYYPAFPTVPTVESIWDYSVNNVSMKSYMISTDGIAANVWTQTSRSLTTTFVDDGSNISHYFATIEDIPGTGDIATSVWTYRPRSITTVIVDDGAPVGSEVCIPTYSNIASIASSVWSYHIGTERTPAKNYLLSIDSIPSNVWTYKAGETETSSDRSLTYYPAFPTVPSAGDIATSVWGYTIGDQAVSASTYLGSIGNIPQATWNYSWGTTATSASVYLGSIYNNTSNITIPTPPTTGAIAASVWNYTDGTRGLTTSFYGAGDTSRFAVKNDIVATPGGITAADVWNYSIENISAISFVQGISTNTNNISVNTGSIATSYTTIAGSIGTNTTDITSIKTSIGSINTSIGSINTSLGTIGGNMVSIASSVDYNNAALLNWNLSTASILALHIGDTTTTYSITRDLAGNITGVSPNN